MSTLIKALVWLLALLKLLTGGGSAKEKWRKEHQRLQEDFDAKKKAYDEAVASGDSTHEPALLAAWVHAAVALNRHRASQS